MKIHKRHFSRRDIRLLLLMYIDLIAEKRQNDRIDMTVRRRLVFAPVTSSNRKLNVEHSFLGRTSVTTSASKVISLATSSLRTAFLNIAHVNKFEGTAMSGRIIPLKTSNISGYQDSGRRRYPNTDSVITCIVLILSTYWKKETFLVQAITPTTIENY